MKQATIGIAAILLFAFAAGAQQASAPSGNSITDAARKLETQMAKNVQAGAEEMQRTNTIFGRRPARTRLAISWAT